MPLRLKICKNSMLRMRTLDVKNGGPEFETRTQGPLGQVSSSLKFANTRNET